MKILSVITLSGFRCKKRYTPLIIVFVRRTIIFWSCNVGNKKTEKHKHKNKFHLFRKFKTFSFYENIKLFLLCFQFTSQLVRKLINFYNRFCFFRCFFSIWSKSNVQQCSDTSKVKSWLKLLGWKFYRRKLIGIPLHAKSCGFSLNDNRAILGLP